MTEKKGDINEAFAMLRLGQFLVDEINGKKSKPKIRFTGFSKKEINKRIKSAKEFEKRQKLVKGVGVDE